MSTGEKSVKLEHFAFVCLAYLVVSLKHENGDRHPGPRIKYGAGFDPGSRGFRTPKGHWIPACAGMTALGALIVRRSHIVMRKPF